MVITSPITQNSKATEARAVSLGEGNPLFPNLVLICDELTVSMRIFLLCFDNFFPNFPLSKNRFLYLNLRFCPLTDIAVTTDLGISRSTLSALPE